MRANIGFVRSFMVVIMLSSSYNYVVGMNMNQDSIDSDCSTSSVINNNSSTANDSCTNLKKKNINDNNCKEITYNPDIMWFDYPALFEQRRKFVLHNFLGNVKQYDKCKIKHINLRSPSLAKDAIINGGVDINTIDSALNGDYSSLTNILENIRKYMRSFRCDSNDYSMNNNSNILQYNYRCLLAIVVQFSGVREKRYRNEYCNLVQNIPSNFYMQNEYAINKVQFDTIVQPLLETMPQD